MRTIILSGFVSFLTVLGLPTALAQEAVNAFTLDVGYGLRLPNTTADNNYEFINVTFDENEILTLDTKQRNGGYGNGIRLGLSYVHTTKSGIRLRGAIRYHSMPEETYLWRREDLGLFLNETTGVSFDRFDIQRYTNSMKSLAFSLGIGMEHRFGKAQKLYLDVFGLMGGVIFTSSKYYDYYYHDISSGTVSYLEWEDVERVRMKDGMAVGVGTTIGFMHNLTERIAASASIEVVMLNHKQTGGTIEFIVNGEEGIEKPMNLQNPTDEAFIASSLGQRVVYKNRPLHSIGLIVGISYSL